MKKIILLLLLLPASLCATCPDTYDSDVKAVYYFENDHADCLGAYPLSVSGTGYTFETDYVKQGSYSAAVTDHSNFANLSASMITYLGSLSAWTIEGWFYQSSSAGFWSGVPIDRLWAGAGGITVAFRATGYGELYYNAGVTSNFDCALTSNAWNFFSVQWSGTQVKLYTNGTLRSTITSSVNIFASNPANGYVALGEGIYGDTWDTHARYDKIIISDIVRNGVETTPIPTTPTFTPTENPASPTDSPTASPTYTITPTWTVNIPFTQTANAIATLTATWNTPTPIFTIPTCALPFPKYFTPIPTPIITPPAGHWYQEPSIMHVPEDIPSRQWHCFISDYIPDADDENILLFTAPDITGPWTQYGTTPIFGDGYGGITNDARMASQLHKGDEYRVYFADIQSTNIRYATSSDGINYTLSPNIVLAAADFEPFCSAPIDGLFPILNPADGNYYATVELQNNGCYSNVPAYIMWLVKSTDGGLTFKNASAVPLLGMGLTGLGYAPLYAGGRSTFYANGYWGSFLHTTGGSFIYYAISPDLYNWYSYFVFPDYVGAYHVAEPGAGYDQVADVSIWEWEGNVYMFMDYDNNGTLTGEIVLYKYPGTLAQYNGCENPSPTPTFTPTFTVTPTFTFTATPTSTYTPTFTVTPTITPTSTVTPTPYANPNLTTASTTMILGHSAIVNLYGILAGNFLFSEEDFNYSTIYFNEISAVPTAGADWNYYNQGPKNGTYYEPVTVTIIPILPGNTTIYGEYDTKLSNGSMFQVFNSLDINIVTETSTFTPTFETPTNTPICSPTFTDTPIPIISSTNTPTNTPATATNTPTFTRTPTKTPDFTVTITPSITRTWTITPTPIVVVILPIPPGTISICTESYLLTGALEYIVHFVPTNYEIHVPVWKNISTNPFYFEYLVQLSGLPNRSKITGLELFVKKNNPQTGAWQIIGPSPVWACLP